MMKKTVLLLACMLCGLTVRAQKVALKNNLLYDATLSPNLGIEIALGQKTTLDISGSYNPFKFGNGKMWKHWIAQPEFRYWFCDRFNGHFLGAHLLGGEYNWANIKLPFGLMRNLRDFRYEGWFGGVGVSYGYQWMISNRWSLELTVGVGYARIHHEKYNCGDCSVRLDKGHTNYYGPTKVGLTFQFFL